MASLGRQPRVYSSHRMASGASRRRPVLTIRCRLLIASVAGDLHVYQLAEGMLVESFSHAVASKRDVNLAVPAPLFSLAVSADSRWVAVGDLHNVVHVYDLRSHAVFFICLRSCCVLLTRLQLHYTLPVY